MSPFASKCVLQPLAQFRGFTLVELMVSITISLIVLSGLSFILVGAHKTNRIQSGIFDLQENGRIGLEVIARDVRGAGYLGCSEGGISFSNHLNTTVTVPAAVKGFEHSTTGSSRKWHPSEGVKFDPPIPGDTRFGDSLVLTYASHTGLYVAATAGTDTSVSIKDEFGNPSVNGINRGDILYLSNCMGSDMFQVSTVDRENSQVSHAAGGNLDPGNATDILGNVYLPGDRVLQFSVSRYFVDIDRKNGNLPTLFWSPNYEDDADSAVAYIPGVENMQILYGEDTGGSSSVDIYRQADNVSNWNNVRTVRLALLLRTETEYGTTFDTNNFRDHNNKISVLDHEFTVDENTRHRWRVYSTTMEIRNGY